MGRVISEPSFRLLLTSIQPRHGNERHNYTSYSGSTITELKLYVDQLHFRIFFPSHRSGRLSLAFMRVEVTSSTSQNQLVIHRRGMVGKFVQSIAEHALLRIYCALALPQHDRCNVELGPDERCESGTRGFFFTSPELQIGQ
jgi:hypothetical protein